MGNKKVLLISPKDPFGGRSVIPPLGLATNASYLPDKYDVMIVDENVKQVNYSGADLVAVTANTITARRAYRLCEEFGEKGVPIVLGGIHPSVMPEEAGRYADAVVVGNGENVWEELLEDFERDRLKKVYRPGTFDLAQSAVPRRDLFKGRYFFDSLQTSRGCPFDCEFCSVTRLYGGECRYKPLDRIRKELESLRTRNFLLVDDNILGVGKKAERRALRLFELLGEYGLHWIGQTSINIADNSDVLRLAQESGAKAFYIGFESLNEDFLRSANKRQNLKKGVQSYKDVIKRIHDHGIAVLASFIYGTDFDTRDSLLRLADFISESTIDATSVKPLTPFPGTRLYERLKQEGRLLDDHYWLEDPYPLFTFQPKKLSLQELAEATMNFLDVYDPLNSTGYFIRSYWLTKSMRASFMAFLVNISDNHTYRKYIRRHKHTLARRFGIDQWRRQQPREVDMVIRRKW
ncbi:B12-binding domain-containing radical SAM protein [Planctomycetota bacterium]